MLWPFLGSAHSRSPCTVALTGPVQVRRPTPNETDVQTINLSGSPAHGGGSPSIGYRVDPDLSVRPSLNPPSPRLVARLIQRRVSGGTCPARGNNDRGSSGMFPS